jgi:hypothetical protein
MYTPDLLDQEGVKSLRIARSTSRPSNDLRRTPASVPLDATSCRTSYSPILSLRRTKKKNEPRELTSNAPPTQITESQYTLDLAASAALTSVNSPKPARKNTAAPVRHRTSSVRRTTSSEDESRESLGEDG